MNALLILLYALADRFAGGGAPNLDDRLPGRALFWGALLCAGAGYLLAGWPAVLLAVVWGLNRAQKPRSFGGSATPTSRREILGTALRFAEVVPAFALIAYFFDRSVLGWALYSVSFVLMATALAVFYGAANQKAQRAGKTIGNENVYVELLRGAAYGLTCWAVLS